MLGKLSRRERVLLCVLAALLGVAGVVYGLVVPMKARHAALETEIALLETQWHAMSDLIAASPALPDSPHMESRLLPPMSDRELDLRLTGLMQAAGLEVQALTLSDTTAAVPTAQAVAIGTADALAALLDGVAAQPDGLVLTQVGYTQGPEGRYTVTLAFALYIHAPSE